MKSVKAFKDWKRTSFESDSIFFTITGSKLSRMSLELEISNLLFLAICSRIWKRHVLNSSNVLLSFWNSQFSKRYANTWIIFCLHILDLKLDEFIISPMAKIIIRPPLRLANSFLLPCSTLLSPADLYPSVTNCPYMNLPKLSFVDANAFGICVVLTVSMRQSKQH